MVRIHAREADQTRAQRAEFGDLLVGVDGRVAAGGGVDRQQLRFRDEERLREALRMKVEPGGLQQRGLRSTAIEAGRKAILEDGLVFILKNHFNSICLEVGSKRVFFSKAKNRALDSPGLSSPVR